MKQKNLLLLILLFIIHNFTFSQEHLTNQTEKNITNRDVLRLVVDKKYNEVIPMLDIMEQQDPHSTYFYTALKIHFAFISNDFNWLLSNLDKIQFTLMKPNPDPKHIIRYDRPNFENTFHRNIEGYRYNDFVNSLWALSRKDATNIKARIEDSHYDQETKDFLNLLEFYYYNNASFSFSYNEYKAVAKDFEKKYPESKYNAFIKEKCIIAFNKKKSFGIAFSGRALIPIDKRKDLDATRSNASAEIGLELELNRNVFGFHISGPDYYLNNNLSIGNKHYKEGDTINNVQFNISYQRVIPIYKSIHLQPLFSTGISYNTIRHDNGKKEIKNRLGNGWNAEIGAAIIWRLKIDKYVNYRRKAISYFDWGISYSYKYINIGKSNRFSLDEGYHMIGILLKFGWVRYLVDRQ